MSNNKYIRYLLLAVVAAFIAGNAFGQIIYDQPAAGSGQVVYTHWKMDEADGEKTLNQLYIPINGFIPLKENLEMQFSVASSSNDLTEPNNDYSVSGLSDLRLQINQSLSDDRFLLSLGFNLPTGKKKLDLITEWPVMEFLAFDYLDLASRHLGEGVGLNLLAGAATQAGEWQLGTSVSFKYNGKYEAYKDGGDYNPGDMFNIAAGADRKFENWMLSVRAAFSTYGTDKLDDEKIYKAGDQLGLQLILSTAKEKYGFATDIGYIIRGRNTRYDSTEAIFDQLKFYGNEFAWSGSMFWIPAEKWQVTPSVEMRFIAANEYGVDDDYPLEKSHLIGFGADIQRGLTKDINLNVGFKYYTGSADGGDIDLSGYRLSGGIVAAFR